MRKPPSRPSSSSAWGGARKEVRLVSYAGGPGFDDPVTSGRSGGGGVGNSVREGGAGGTGRGSGLPEVEDKVRSCSKAEEEATAWLGTGITFPQPGHLTFLPAASSLTESFFWQEAQVKAIMDFLRAHHGKQFRMEMEEVIVPPGKDCQSFSLVSQLFVVWARSRVGCPKESPFLVVLARGGKELLVRPDARFRLLAGLDDPHESYRRVCHRVSVCSRTPPPPPPRSGEGEQTVLPLSVSGRELGEGFWK